MSRRVPVVATLVVLLAVAAMVGLGFWQLHRLVWKEDLLAHYDAAGHQAAPVAWPASEPSAEPLLYRRTSIDCAHVAGIDAMAGRNAAGQSGWAVVARCASPAARVVLGWAPGPQNLPAWQGGPATGWLAPGPRLVADPPLAGLQPNARPDPSEIPNNHLAYAVQWFLFALTALVIYIIALKRRR